MFCQSGDKWKNNHAHRIFKFVQQLPLMAIFRIRWRQRNTVHIEFINLCVAVLILTLSSRALFLNLSKKTSHFSALVLHSSKKTSNFAVLVLHSNKLVHWQTKNMPHFTQNLIHSLMNFFLAFQNDRIWFKIWKSQIVFEQRISTLSVG